ncbi:MAG: LacI family DNA-binding transcriptional regulator [Saprospiraceae bacterium]|nr:LacI family DNA-binding transcriptional regulator [Saprospiraceae bacterium]
MDTITIKDIARALNLSTSTVSRALRDSYEINPETKRLVMEYAEKMHYRPNPIALSLKENRSQSIGVIVPEIANNYFSQAINGIEAAAYDRGYHVVIFQSQESYEREVEKVEHLAARRVDGLLMSLSSNTTDIEHLKSLHARGMPLVFFDRIPAEIDTHKVVTDNASGAFKATEHLLATGRRRIAHITSQPGLSITKERLHGYRMALEQYGLPFDENLVKYCSYTQEEVKYNLDTLFGLASPPDAFLTATDRFALGYYAALKKRLIRIPEDIAFVGFSNLNVAELLNPAMSTVVQPAFQMGHTAAGLLLDLVEKKPKQPVYATVQLPAELFVRESSALKQG